MKQATNGRRRFLGGLFAAGLMPLPTWADAGSPVLLSAAATPAGDYVLCGIGADMGVRFELPLPARGHAAAAHPTRPEAVAFARRPGTFAVVLDCVTGTERARLRAPAGRHFYGHGAFSADGGLLYTTENNYAAGHGVIGVWDRRAAYRRVAEWASHGFGPHDIKRLPNSETLVVANGGIDTHPDTGRTKLNIATMQPNLAYIENGVLRDRVTLAPELHKNSIRHLAISAQGHVAFGMQWQGADHSAASLVGLHRLGAGVRLMKASAKEQRLMQGYVGSVAMTPDGGTIAVTSPRGGMVQYFDTTQGQLTHTEALGDVCGITAIDRRFVLSSGQGVLWSQGSRGGVVSNSDRAWDNHLVRI